MSFYLSILTILLFIVSGVQVQAADDAGNIINDIAWNADGSLLAAGFADGTLQLMDIHNTLVEAFELGQDSVKSISWNPLEPRQLAVTTDHGGLKIVEVADGQVHVSKQDFETDQEIVMQATWSPDGNRLATIETRGSGVGGISKVMIWNPETEKLFTSYENGSFFSDIEWNPQKPNELLITGVVQDFDQYPIEIFLWDVETNQVRWQLEEPDTGITSVAWNSAGTQFAALTTLFTDDGGGISRVQIYDGKNGDVVTQIPVNQNYLSTQLTWTPGTYLAIDAQNAIDLWNVETSELIAHIEIAEYVSTFAWFPDGSQVSYAVNGKIEFVTLSPLISS